jgi:hypothetical protein
MVNFENLSPATIDGLKKIYTEKRETLEYMSRFGNGIEKAMACLVLEVGGKK